jgi:hypothetical protein
MNWLKWYSFLFLGLLMMKEGYPKGYPFFYALIALKRALVATAQKQVRFCLAQVIQAKQYYSSDQCCREMRNPLAQS